MASSTTQMRMFFGSMPSSKLQFLLLSRKTKQNTNLSCQPYNQLTHFWYHNILTSIITGIGVLHSLCDLQMTYMACHAINVSNIEKIIIFFQHHNLTHSTETLYIYYICYTIQVTSIHVKCIRSIAFYAFCNLDMENHWWQFKTC